MITVYDLTLQDYINIFSNKNILVEYDGIVFRLNELKQVARDLRILDIKTRNNRIFKLNVTDNELFKIYFYYKKHFDKLIFKNYYTGKIYDKEILYFTSPSAEITSIEYLPYNNALMIEFKGKI